MADVADRVEKHFRLFNEAVRSQDWAAFLATFTPDAVMSFEGVPAGPYIGPGPDHPRVRRAAAVGHDELRVRRAGR